MRTKDVPKSANSSGITRKQEAHLGRLARLSRTDDELDHYSSQLADILGAVARRSEVATPDVPATSHPMPLSTVFREDVLRPSLAQADALEPWRLNQQPGRRSADRPRQPLRVPLPAPAAS